MRRGISGLLGYSSEPARFLHRGRRKIFTIVKSEEQQSWWINNHRNWFWKITISCGVCNAENVIFSLFLAISQSKKNQRKRPMHANGRTDGAARRRKLSRVDESISRCPGTFRAVSSGKQNYKSIFHVINRIFKLTSNLDTKNRRWREMKWIEMGKSLTGLVDAESRLSRGRHRWCFMETLRAIQNGLRFRKASGVRLSAQSIQTRDSFWSSTKLGRDNRHEKRILNKF